MLITGAKGFAKELLVAIKDNGISDFVFYDDLSQERNGCIFENYKVLATPEEAKLYLTTIDNRFVVGIGNPALRWKIANQFIEYGGCLTSLISVKSSIGLYNSIEKGTVIQQSVIIENENKICEGCLINTGSFISHDVVIGKYSEISPFVKVLGNVKIGNFCLLGTGCIILPGLTIGNNVVVGAGAVVTKSIENNTTVMGVPAVSKNK